MSVFTKNYCFIFALIIYLLVALVQILEFKVPTFVSSYIADLCCMPVVLSICLFVLRQIQKEYGTLPRWFISLMVIYWGWYFEYYLPQTSHLYTADLIDVLMYALGALIFYLWQNNNRNILEF